MGYATETLTAIPFGALIGGPLKAAIEAQALAARTTIDFIKAVGFEPPKASDEDDPFSIEPNPEPKEPALGPVRNVTFTYQVEQADGTKQLATLTVPILTIVPIPYIRIDEMTIDFTAKIVEQQVNKSSSSYESSSSQSQGSSYGWGAWWWWGAVNVNYNSSFSSKHSSSSSSASKYQTEYTMNVHVRAVQDDIPAGLSRILTILSDTIKEARAALPEPTKQTAPAPAPFGPK